MAEYQAYGNNWEMILFSVTISEKMVEELIRDGYLEEGEFDSERYFEETDADYCKELAQPVLNSIIDFYENKVDEYEDKISDSEEQEMWDEFTDLGKIEFVSLFEDFKHCSKWGYESLVVVYTVDPKNPYKGFIGGF